MTRQLASPRQISRIKDLTSKTSKDWSEDSELDMEFNESTGSSRRKIKKENSRKGLSKFGNIKVSLRCVKKVIIVILKAPDAGN